MYNVQCTIYNKQYTIYNMQYTIYNIQYTMYNIRYTIYDIQYTVYNIRCCEKASEAISTMPTNQLTQGTYLDEAYKLIITPVV